MAVHRTDEERFWAFVEKTDTCWLWRGSVKHDGYGQFSIKAKPVRAYKWAYEHFVAAVPKGLSLDHLCRVRHCVNPEHLEPVPQRINVLRGSGVSARAAAATHCPSGHAYDLFNTHWYQGRRYCRPCNTARVSARRAKERYS